MNDLRDHVREIADFPRPGILFRDIGPLLRSHLPTVLDALERLCTAQEWSAIDVIGVIDARGFVLGAGLAARLDKGVVMIRKAGKLPPPVVRRDYGLEYGTATLEMQPGAGRMLIVDDVLATGGTLRAAADLALRAGYDLRGAVVLADLGLATPPTVGAGPVRFALGYA